MFANSVTWGLSSGETHDIAVIEQNISVINSDAIAELESCFAYFKSVSNFL